MHLASKRKAMGAKQLGEKATNTNAHKQTACSNPVNPGAESSRNNWSKPIISFIECRNICLATDSSVQKITLKPEITPTRNTVWTLESFARFKCFLQGSVAGKVFFVPLNEQKSKCDMKLRKKQIQGHRLVEITNACSNYFLYRRKTHACFAMYGVL